MSAAGSGGPSRRPPTSPGEEAQMLCLARCGPRRMLAVERRLQAANRAEVGAEGERLEPNAELGEAAHEANEPRGYEKSMSCAVAGTWPASVSTAATTS